MIQPSDLVTFNMVFVAVIMIYFVYFLIRRR